jgi:hypothetical protein
MKAQYIEISEYGNKYYFSDKEMRIIHREDGPAVELGNGTKRWHLNGSLHREDGPAIEWEDGDEWWYFNGLRHRKDGPAIETIMGKKEWWLNGKLHREDGPAVELIYGDKEWWLNGVEYSEEDFNQKMNRAKTININGREFTIEELSSLIVTVEK